MLVEGVSCGQNAIVAMGISGTSNSTNNLLTLLPKQKASLKTRNSRQQSGVEVLEMPRLRCGVT